MARQRIYGLVGTSPITANTVLLLDDPSWCAAQKIKLTDLISWIVLHTFCEFSDDFSDDFSICPCDPCLPENAVVLIDDNAVFPDDSAVSIEDFAEWVCEQCETSVCEFNDDFNDDFTSCESPPTFCDDCPEALPVTFSLETSGFDDLLSMLCTDCTSLNGDFVLDQVADCEWRSETFTLCPDHFPEGVHWLLQNQAGVHQFAMALVNSADDTQICSAGPVTVADCVFPFEFGPFIEAEGPSVCSWGGMGTVSP